MDKCPYPLCQGLTFDEKGRTIQDRHTLRACKSIVWGCKNCRLRGHRVEECPGKTPGDRERSRMIFERYADSHHLAKRRREWSFLGPFFMNYKFFRTVPICPWSHAYMVDRDVTEMIAEMDYFVYTQNQEAAREALRKQFKEQEIVRKALHRDRERERAEEPEEPEDNPGGLSGESLAPGEASSSSSSHQEPSLDPSMS
jgi:hypothetical protein